jgi:histidinol-phosphate aminotransferase
VISPLARRALFDLVLPPPYGEYRPGWTERMYTNPHSGERGLYPCPRPDLLQETYARWLSADLARRGQQARVAAERVLFTAGSLAGIDLLVRAFCEPGTDTICIQTPTFPLYAHHARAAGVGVVDIPLLGPDLDRLDLDRIVGSGAKLTFVCRPNNPAGSAPAYEDLQALADRISGLLVVDEAYLEFCDVPSALGLLDRPNVVVLRTFSKAWGLASVRAGAVMADPGVLHALRLLADPFAFSVPAQRAVADVLADPERALAPVAQIRAQREQMRARLSALPGVRVLPSETNFVLVRLARPISLPRTELRLARSAVPGAIRIAVGSPEEDGLAVDLVAQLTQEALPLSELLRRQTTSHLVSQALYVVAKLDLAQALADGPRSASSLACEAGLHPPSLLRLLRALVEVGVLADHGAGVFALTELGQRLRGSAPGSLRSAVLLHGEEAFRACGGLLESVRTGGSAFGRMHGLELYRYLECELPAARTFYRAMTELLAPVAPALVRACGVPDGARVVDVGGGEGQLLAALLASNPTLSGLLFELPPALARADEVLGPVLERCELQPGDFFAALPEGGDVYLLKSVLHDWDDERASLLLHNLRKVMPPSGKLLLIEQVMPPGEPPLERCLDDIVQMTLSGGQERSVREYAALLANSGFTLSQVQPTGTDFSILQGDPT